MRWAERMRGPKLAKIEQSHTKSHAMCLLMSQDLQEAIATLDREFLWSTRVIVEEPVISADDPSEPRVAVVHSGTTSATRKHKLLPPGPLRGRTSNQYWSEAKLFAQCALVARARTSRCAQDFFAIHALAATQHSAQTRIFRAGSHKAPQSASQPRYSWYVDA